MIQTTAITEAITMLTEAEQRFKLQRIEDERFFSEWWEGLPDITDQEKAELDELRRRYLYHRSEGNLLEGTVTLLVASPLLAVAGLYDPPFRMKAEASVRLTITDDEEVLQGRIDVLILQEQFWVIIVKSKKPALSIWVALPQVLAYLMGNPYPERPVYGMVTNGDEILFVKLIQSETSRYALSRIFALFSSNRELQEALRILKRIGQVITQG